VAPRWGAERRRGDVLLEGLPVEPGSAAAWSRGEAWSGGPAAMAVRGQVVAGPGERVPAMPWPALGELAVRRGQPALASPGGQIVELEPRTDAGSLLHLGGPGPRGAARLASEREELPASAAVEVTPEYAMGAAHAGLWDGGNSLELLALGSSGEGTDGLLLMDGTFWPSYAVRVRGTALARRWVSDGQTVDRLAGGGSLTWSSRHGSWALGSQLEQHADILRASLYTSGEVTLRDSLTLQAGARGVREGQGEAERLQLGPQVQAAWRIHRWDLELVGSAWGDPGMWMPEGVGTELPATRTLQLLLYRGLHYGSDVWVGLRRLDAGEPGDLALVGGLELDRSRVELDLDGAISPAGRWSTATAASVWHLPHLETRLGLVSTWRSVLGTGPPPGAWTALPFSEAAHLDTGARLTQPILLRHQTLVLEGTLWTRLADSDPDDQTFTGTSTVGPGEVAVRLEW
jgi:hypothetical protein